MKGHGLKYQVGLENFLSTSDLFQVIIIGQGKMIVAKNVMFTHFITISM